MNESPIKSVKDLMLENEALHEDNETLFKTNEGLILEIRNLREELDQTHVLNNNTIYEINGEHYSLHEIIGFIETSKELAKKVERQNRFINGIKLHNQELTIERNALVDELNTIKSMGMFEFANSYCDEKQNAEAGKQFAKSLLGGK